MRSSAYRWNVLLFAAVFFSLCLLLAAASCGGGGKGTVLVAMGTTIQDTGLLDELSPAFEDETGYRLVAIAVGTGQALEMAKRGDVDAVFTHDPMLEEAFVADGFGVNRQLVMNNDFVVAGPADDPAGVRDASDAAVALRRIAAAGETFVSRGDSSGTNLLELRLWTQLGIEPAGESWYVETGQGMAATLQVAQQRSAYTLSDRGTFLAQRENLDLEIALEGDPVLINIYHAMQVDPDRVDGVNTGGAKAFVDFLTSGRAQRLIGEFGREEFGRPLFIPDAGKDESELTLTE